VKSKLTAKDSKARHPMVRIDLQDADPTIPTAKIVVESDLKELVILPLNPKVVIKKPDVEIETKLIARNNLTDLNSRLN